LRTSIKKHARPDLSSKQGLNSPPQFAISLARRIQKRGALLGVRQDSRSVE
jgi:hypothetical protein